MAITRISVTLPRELAKAIDAKARELDRSRSWVIAEGARQFLSKPDATKPSYVAVPGLGESRQRQLEADLALAPADRVRAAEETARVGELVGKHARQSNQVVSFDSYEDYLDWKRREAIRS